MSQQQGGLSETYSSLTYKLNVARGPAYSAALIEERENAAVWDAPGDGDRCLPIGHRIQGNLDTTGLEQASTDKHLPASNVGYALLLRMGWTPGRGLGAHGQGVVEPVRQQLDEPGMRLGLGKQEEARHFTAAENVVRRPMEVEIQADESEGRRERREAEVERLDRIKADVAAVKRTFYCDICKKQYHTTMQFEEHLSSYDHHHVKRAAETRAAMQGRNREKRARTEAKQRKKEQARLASQLEAAYGGAGQAPTAAPLPRQEPPPLPPEPPGTAADHLQPGPAPAAAPGGGFSFGLTRGPKPAPGMRASAGIARATPKPKLKPKAVVKLAAFGASSSEEDA